MPKLAALGGTPVAENGIRIEWPEIGPKEREAVLATLERREWCRLWSAEDSEASKFEREWARYHDARHCVAVANGTVALMCAFRALGVWHGDEVIVPSVTFVATADAVGLCGAIPVFVDVDPDTYQIDPAAAESAITDRTKAICVVHYAGYPADLDRLKELSDRTGLPVVEDCAHAHGTEWRGRKVGAHITLGCFSFQQSKSLTAGEGGAVITDSQDLADRVWAIHNVGRTRDAARYTHSSLGGNFRMSEWEATILRCQMVRLQEQTERRMRSAELIAEGLAQIDGLSLLKPDSRITQRGFYFLIIRYDATKWDGIHRDVFLRALQAEGIPCGTAYGWPVYKNPSYASGGVPHRVMDCPNAERITAEEQIATWNHLLLHVRNAILLVEACAKIRENIDELRRLAQG
ncbi:MAG: DegT/DnrJ/EryC1/StrS family aminotransferase [Armatimonadota bacterium]|nr:DegT/DnrJ/EryC1/StrS family aminotransferase [Armatimonadota bacterium]